MLQLTVIIFTLAMLAGITLISFYAMEKPRPKVIVFLHGPLAIAGYICLIITATQVYSYYLIFSIFFFTIAAPVGAFIFYRDKIKKQPAPKYFPVLHALFAVSGLICLFTYYIRVNDIWIF